jgi:hypothetical protein
MLDKYIKYKLGCYYCDSFYIESFEKGSIRFMLWKEVNFIYA